MAQALGQSMDTWKLHNEKIMVGLTPTGGWEGTLGESVGRAELLACDVIGESTISDVVHVTHSEIFVKRQDKGVG